MELLTVRYKFKKTNIKCALLISNIKKLEKEELYKNLESGNIDIIIGTQIITKGYDFPFLDLVAIIDSDAAFMSSDLKASENACFPAI